MFRKILALEARFAPWPRALKLVTLWLLFLWFTSIAAFSDGIDRRIHWNPLLMDSPEALPLLSSADEMLARESDRPMYRGSDAGSFLSAGKRLIELRQWEHDYAVFWPAAMPFVIAVVLLSTGGDVYPLKMVVFNAWLWSVCLLIAFLCLRVTPSRTIDFVLLVSFFFLLPAFRGWMFGIGALMSEGPSHAIFVAAISVLVRAVLSRSIWLYIAAALLMALAAHFRSVFETFGGAMFLVPLVFCSLWIAYELVTRRGRPRGRSLVILGCLLAAWFTFTKGLEPWRRYKMRRWGHSEWYFQTDRYKYGPQWMNDSELGGLPFANTSCKIDPELCAVVQSVADKLPHRSFRDLMFMTFATHPIEWISFRLRNGLAFWFGASREHLGAHPGLIAEGVLLFLIGLFGLGWLVWLLVTRPNAALLQIACFFGVFMLLNLSIFLFFHVEWRYSHSARTFAYFLPLWVATLWRAQRSSP